MKMFIKKFKDQDIINRIQNKFFIRIGLFTSLNTNFEIQTRQLDTNYFKKQVDSSDELLLKEYANKHRGKNHYQKNILPRLRNENGFKGFAVIDQKKNKIAYLSWIGFKNITIPEIDYNKKLVVNEVYFFDDHCVKEHQRKGLHSTVFNERMSYCKKNLVKRVFIVIYLNNLKALNNLKKYDFKLTKIFTFYPLLKKIFSVQN